MKLFAKNIWFIAIAVAAMTLSGCHKEHHKDMEYVFTLYNNSDDIIGWYISNPYRTAEDGNEFPEYMPESLDNEYKYIRPGDKYSFLAYEIPSEYRASDAVRLYIFPVRTLTDYTWDQIRSDKLYEYRFDLKAEEVKEQDRKIYYTGENNTYLY
ncbi:MAG: hypothetical protein NC115_04630 [Bacteroidales bacterium]|nr:hypothetical protein [Bacteroidales bacterium]